MRRRLPGLAAARLPVPPLAALPALPGRPSRRALALVLGGLAAFAAAYGIARVTPLFAVGEIHVGGAPAPVADAVRAELADVRGTSLAALDPGELERRIREIPSVRSASVDRAFPNTLAVSVRPESPIAVVRDGDRAWLIAESGRIVAAVEPHARPRLPRIHVDLGGAPTLGRSLSEPPLTTALGVLGRVPDDFPARVLFARVKGATATLVVSGWVEVRLDDAGDVAAQLAAAGAVLRGLSDEERTALAYLDVSLPARVVAGPKTQPLSEG